MREVVLQNGKGTNMDNYSAIAVFVQLTEKEKRKNMVIKCNNGHWYDSNVDLVCPHCKRENGKLAIKLDDKEEDE